MLRFPTEAALIAALGDRIKGSRTIICRDDSSPEYVIAMDKAKRGMKKQAPTDSSLEALMGIQIRASKLPKPVKQCKFHATRKWRFDMAWPDKKVALEVDGGIWRKNSKGAAAGAHSRPANIERDIEKGNAAIELGWTVIRATPQMVRSGEALRLIERVLK